MSDDFAVPVSSSNVLRADVLTSNMAADVADRDRVPVLFADRVYYFHDVSGGYDTENDTHVVQLIHTVQGRGNPPSKPRAEYVEVHGDDRYYRLHVTDATYWDDQYPADDYVITLTVDSYQSGPYSFADELCREQLDYRPTEVSFDE